MTDPGDLLNRIQPPALDPLHGCHEKQFEKLLCVCLQEKPESMSSLLASFVLVPHVNSPFQSSLTLKPTIVTS
jgi:hypothetical protein